MAATLWFAEQRVNTSTTGEQYAPSIVKLNNGNFVIVWQDDGVGAGDIKAQLFSAGGVRIGSEFTVASGAGAQVRPAVTALTDGRFRVVWEQPADPSTGFARDYNADGTASTAAYLWVGGPSSHFEIAPLAGGGSMGVLALAGDIYFNTTTAAGAQGPNGIVNTTTAGTQAFPDIARLTSGAYAIVWVDTNVHVRLLNANGTFAGAQFQANVFTPVAGAGDTRATVTSLSSGGFVVTWTSSAGGFPGSSFDIRARMFDASGNAYGADFLVNTSVNGIQTNVQIVDLKDGGFLMMWNDNSSGFVRGAQFDSTGGRVGGDFAISTGQSTNVGFPRTVSATLLDDGRVAVAFVGPSGLGDGDTSVRLQIIDPRNGQVDGTGAAETIYGGQFDDQVVALAGNDTVFALSGQDVVYGGLGNDTVFGDVGDDILYGGDGNDLLNSGTGADVVYAELGDDTVFAELGDDLVFAADGNDTINGGAGDDAVYGQNGDDVVFGDAGADAFFGGFGNDSNFAGIGSDVAFGEEGGDTLIGDDGDDVLDGGAGGDVLNGGNGVDNLIGGGEGDILIGGPGGDRLEGGAGGDLYWWQAQTELNDLVVGFNSAEDQLQFTGSQFGGFTAGSNLLNGSTFISSANPNPTGAVPTFLYNNADGSLFFDPDGTGGAARIFVALFQGAPALTAGDFQFV